jgi:hypothetical protein
LEAFHDGSVLTDEGREDLHDGGVVPGRVSGDALQGIYAAEADIELFGAELFDGLV